MYFMTPAQEWDWLGRNWLTLVTPAAVGVVVLILAFLAVGRLRPRTQEPLPPEVWARRVRLVVLPAVLAWETQGVYQLAGRHLHAPHDLAVIFAGTGSGLLILFALFAEGHHRRHTTLGPNGRRMRWSAAMMGTAVATAATSLPEFLARLAIPVLAIMAWSARFAPDEPPDPSAGATSTRRSRSRWIWTLSKIGTAIGLLTVSEDDIVHDNPELLIRSMERHAAGEHDGVNTWTRAWHGRRLARLAARVTDLAVVAEVQRRRTHAVHIVSLVRASNEPPTLDGSPKEILDDGESPGDIGDDLSDNATSGYALRDRVTARREPVIAPQVADDRYLSGDQSSVGNEDQQSVGQDRPVAEPDELADARRRIYPRRTDAIRTQRIGTDRPKAEATRTRCAAGDRSTMADRSADQRPATADGPAASRGRADADVQHPLPERNPRVSIAADHGATGGGAPRGDTDNRAIREDAITLYLQSESAGKPLTGAALARMYKRTNPRWGTRIVAAAKARSVAAGTGTDPIAANGASEENDDG